MPSVNKLRKWRGNESQYGHKRKNNCAVQQGASRPGAPHLALAERVRNFLGGSFVTHSLHIWCKIPAFLAKWRAVHKYMCWQIPKNKAKKHKTGPFVTQLVRKCNPFSNVTHLQPFGLIIGNHFLLTPLRLGEVVGVTAPIDNQTVIVLFCRIRSFARKEKNAKCKKSKGEKGGEDKGMLGEEGGVNEDLRCRVKIGRR